MIFDFQSNANITDTDLRNKNCDESYDENKCKTESSSPDIKNCNRSNVDERRDYNVKDNKEHGTVKNSQIKITEQNRHVSIDSNTNHNQTRKETTKYENNKNVHESRINNAEEGRTSRAFVENKDQCNQTCRTDKNIDRVSTGTENLDQLNMGQAAPNCKKNIPDGEHIAARIQQSDKQENEDKNNRRNGGGIAMKGSIVGESNKDNEGLDRYEDCVICVSREISKGDDNTERDSVSSKDIPGKIFEENKGTKLSEVSTDAADKHKKENDTNLSKPREDIQPDTKLSKPREDIQPDTKLSKPHEDIQSIADAKNMATENGESQRADGDAAVVSEVGFNKQDIRKLQESIKKKYVAENHMKIGDAVERSWDTDVVVGTRSTQARTEQNVPAENKGILTDSATPDSTDNRNDAGSKSRNIQTQGLADVGTSNEVDNDGLQKIEGVGQDKLADDLNNDDIQPVCDVQDSKSDSKGLTEESDSKDKRVEDNVDERRGEADADAGNDPLEDDPVEDDPLSDSGICYYKSKCLLKNQETMNRKEKVKVDESEPSWHEEAPFERRDVVVKKDKWVTDLYAVDSLLGRGKFGEVKKCRERRTGRQLAAKFIEVSGPQDRTDIMNEVEIMKHLQHPRLLQLYDAFEHRDRFCLVLELVSGGELFERVINDDFILTEKACVMFTRQICDGVAFMHSENILHLDMKPENILCLTREGNRIKIIDFGLARKYNPKDDLRVLFGTPEFVAPEVVNFDPICPGTDMWSVGVICYVLLSGLSPFMGETEAETLSNVTMARWDFNAEEFENISAEAKDFISKLLVKDPRKRLSSALCLDHQWLRRSTKRESRLPERSLSKKRLRKFVYRRKWQKAINAMLALRRMGVSLC